MNNDKKSTQAFGAKICYYCLSENDLLLDRLTMNKRRDNSQAETDMNLTDW